MSLLQQVQRGKAHLPPRILVYGTEGVGKSSLAATTPKPIFIQTEDGLGEIDCDRFPLAKSLEDVVAALTELETQPHDYQTVAIDSLDWLERLIWDAICRRESATTIEKVGGGYGKGYTLALDYWRKLIDKLGNLHRDRGMMIFLIAHAKVEKFEDPEAPAYDRYSPRLHKHASAIITEWCEPISVPRLMVVLRDAFHLKIDSIELGPRLARWNISGKVCLRKPVSWVVGNLDAEICDARSRLLPPSFILELADF
jgi:hypothetical protein